MNLLWHRDQYDLEVAGVHFYVTSIVRNEIAPVYVRRLHEPKEVVRTVTSDRKKGLPYMPRKFPLGDWTITAVERNGRHGMSFDEAEYGPVRIRTNAHQTVTVWALDDAGGYDHALDEMVEDYGYLLHWAPFSRTTLGCGRVGKEDAGQIEQLAKIIEGALLLQGAIPLKVV